MVFVAFLLAAAMKGPGNITADRDLIAKTITKKPRESLSLYSLFLYLQQSLWGLF